MQHVLQQSRAPLFYSAVVAVSLPAGVMVVWSERLAMLPLFAVFALGYLVFLFALPPQTLFLGWLFLAPLFQDAAERGPAFGAILVYAFYVVPALVLCVITVLRRNRDVRLTLVDYLPAAFLAYTFVVVVGTSEAIQETPKVVFTTVLLAPVVYYFLRVGPGISIPYEKIVKVLMYTAVLQGLMGIVNFATGYNLWDDTHWQEGSHSDFPRAVATLSNPAVLGLVLGIGMVFATAVLSWDGPRSLRRASIAMLVVGTPALAMTMTRGAILAGAVGVGLVLLFGRWRLQTLVGIFAFALVLLALLPRIQATELYQGRITNRGNISARAALQDVSLDLAAQKPILGWGHGSFDEAKNKYAFDVGGVPVEAVLENTSHNTYLTILVELGIVGLLLFAVPFVVIATAGLSRIHDPTPDRWLLIASLASLLLVVLGAMTFDLRFFSFAQLLPWIFLAIMRRLLERPRLVPERAAVALAQR